MRGPSKYSWYICPIPSSLSPTNPNQEEEEEEEDHTP